MQTHLPPECRVYFAEKLRVHDKIHPASKEVTGQPGKSVRCYIKAVSHFPEKGGEAYGSQAKETIPALSDMLHRYPLDNDHHIPESTLAARMVPERLMD